MASLPWNFGCGWADCWVSVERHWVRSGPTRRGGKVNSGPCLPTKKHGWHRVATSTPRGCRWKNYLSVLISAPRRAERYNYSSHVVAPSRESRVLAPVANRVGSPLSIDHPRSNSTTLEDVAFVIFSLPVIVSSSSLSLTVAGSAVTRLKSYFACESCKVSLYGYDLAIKIGIVLRFQ